MKNTVTNKIARVYRPGLLENCRLLSYNWNVVGFFPRMVCESLINTHTLEWERTQLWALTFKLVRNIIGGVDYKVFFF